MSLRRLVRAHEKRRTLTAYEPVWNEPPPSPTSEGKDEFGYIGPFSPNDPRQTRTLRRSSSRRQNASLYTLRKLVAGSECIRDLPRHYRFRTPKGEAECALM
jgi:hypothetical protein